MTRDCGAAVNGSRVSARGSDQGWNQDAPGAGGCLELVVLGGGGGFETVQGVVHGRDEQRDVGQAAGQRAGWPGLVRGAAGQGPAGIGVGQAAGPQGQVAGFSRRLGGVAGSLDGDAP